jgi:hypothetical protein
MPPIGEVGSTEQLLRPSVMTTVTDHVATRSHLRAIAAAKRKNHPSQRWWVDLFLSAYLSAGFAESEFVLFMTLYRWILFIY